MHLQVVHRPQCSEVISLLHLKASLDEKAKKGASRWDSMSKPFAPGRDPDLDPPFAAGKGTAYEGDNDASPMAYLACGSKLKEAVMVGGPGGPVQAAPPRPASQELGSWLWYHLFTAPANRNVVMSIVGRSSEARIASDKARASILKTLFKAGRRPNLAVVTDRADGLLHLCLMNGGSFHVLQMLLEGLPDDYPANLRPNLQVCKMTCALESMHDNIVFLPPPQGLDASGRTPFELAAYLGQWEAVGQFIRAGALQVCISFSP